MEQNWKEPNKIEGDLAGKRSWAYLRRISRVVQRCLPSPKEACPAPREIFFLLVRRATSAPARRDLRHLSGISPGRSLGWAHVFKTVLPDIEVVVEATEVSGWDGFATAAPSSASKEALLGIVRHREETVALLPGKILSPRGLTPYWEPTPDPIAGPSPGPFGLGVTSR